MLDSEIESDLLLFGLWDSTRCVMAPLDVIVDIMMDLTLTWTQYLWVDMDMVPVCGCDTVETMYVYDMASMRLV